MNYLPSSAVSDTFDVGLAQVGTLATGSSAHSSCAFSWPAVTGAAQYQIYNGSTLVKTVTGTSSGTISVAQNRQYSWRVRAINGARQGAFSNYLYFNGGRPRIRVNGTKTVRCEVVRTGSYRRDSGWGQTGDRVYQGWYSTSYGGAGYFGLAVYGDVYSKVRSAVGTSVDMSKVSVTSCRVWFHRNSGVGTWGSARTMIFTASDATSTTSGGDPSGQWQPTSKSIPAAPWWSNGLELGARFGEEFVKYKHKSICVRNHNSTNYMGTNGKSSGSWDWDMQIAVKWDYDKQTYIAPRWWR